MKIIIVGAGEVGYHIARKLSEENHDIVLIDNDPDKIKRVNDDLDVQGLTGSGTSPRDLKSSGIEQADMMVVATDSDEVNLISCLLAQNLNPRMLKLARVRNPEYLEEKNLFSQELLGVAQVINPVSVMVETILRLIEIPGASDVVEFENGLVSLVAFTVRHDSVIKGRPLSSLKQTERSFLAGAIIRANQVFIPKGTDVFLEGDLVYVVVKGKELDHIFQLFNIKNKPPKMVIVVGGGQTGTTLSQSLDKTPIVTKIIEKDESRCTELAASLDRAIVIHGDGTEESLLQEENVCDADFLVAVTDDEECNILISLMAKNLGVSRVITRVSKLSYISLISKIGIEAIISPRLSAARAMLQHIRQGRIISVAPLKGEHAEALEVEALDTSGIVDLPLRAAAFPDGALVGAVIRKNEIIIPDGESVIQPGDRLIIFCTKTVIPKIEKLFSIEKGIF